jgi:Fe-Mn family superoxide dismutase
MLRQLGTGAASLWAAPLLSARADTVIPTADFRLPPLPYAYDALEPYIDARTMEIHHDKHHQAYVTALNKALDSHPDQAGKSIESLLTNIDALPADIRTAVRNNGGGHHNHSLFWGWMKPRGGGEPTGALAEALKKTFGDFASFKQQFSDAGLKRFGSGWSWLVRTGNGDLKIYSTPNQDSPVMEGHTPLLGLDVWEHAYYLRYQNRRADYISAWWNVVNWEAVAERLS